MSVHQALDAVAGSTSTAEVAAAMRLVRKEVRAERAQFAQSTLGPLARTYLEAMRMWDEQKAAGVSRADRMQQLTGVIRVSWPFVREWVYLCDTCQDLGLEIQTCHGDACGRKFPHGPHSYGMPCFCSKGQKFRAKPKPSAEDFTQAGKAKPKASGFTRMGR